MSNWVLERFALMARQLYRQRQSWQDEVWLSLDALSGLERRLQVYLHALTRARDNQPADISADEGQGGIEGLPDRDDALFVDLACRMRGTDPNARREAAGLACACLKEAAHSENDKVRASQRAIAAVFSLFPCEASKQALEELYGDAPETRAAIFDIWTEQGADVAVGLINQAELQGQSLDLQRAAISYAASRPEMGLDMFRFYYRSLGHAQGGTAARTPASALIPALRGGLVRGDEQAPVALRRAIELEEDRASLIELLRLLALHGDASLYPVLRQFASAEPEQGLALIALSGHFAAVSDLLEALHQPRTNAAAASAWFRLTGQRLAQRPRLSVVGEAESARTAGEDTLVETASEAGDGADVIFDAEQAETWWAENQAQWREYPRWMLGRPLEPSTLLALAREWGGAFGRDVMDLLAMQQRRPLAVGSYALVSTRLSVLEGGQAEAFDTAKAPDKAVRSTSTTGRGAGASA